MATEWERATDGRHKMRVQPMGQGSEATIVRLLKAGTTQAAALTASALGELDESFNVLTIPFFFESDAETRHLLDVLRPRFERALEAEGLILINWGNVGWAHLFSADPVRSLADLKKTKLYTSAGDDRTVQWYRQNDFDPVPLEIKRRTDGFEHRSHQCLSVPALRGDAGAVLSPRAAHARPSAGTAGRRNGDERTRMGAAQSGGSGGTPRRR